MGKFSVTPASTGNRRRGRQLRLLLTSIAALLIGISLGVTPGGAIASSKSAGVRPASSSLGLNYPLTAVPGTTPMAGNWVGNFNAVPTPGPSSTLTAPPSVGGAANSAARRGQSVSLRHTPPGFIYPGHPYRVAVLGQVRRLGAGDSRPHLLPNAHAPHLQGRANLGDAHPNVALNPSFNPKWTVNKRGGYGDPTDSNIATDGSKIVLAYNGVNQMIFEVTDLQGNELGYKSYCGYNGFNSCSDPSIIWDATNNVWTFSYLARCDTTLSNHDDCPTQTGDELVFGETSTPLNGFHVATIALTTNGFVDQPRLAHSLDKIVASTNFFVSKGYANPCPGGTDPCARVFVLNLGAFYQGGQFNWTYFQEQGHSLVPASTNNWAGLTLVESADWGTPQNGDASWFVYQPESSVLVAEYTFPDGFPGIDQAGTELFSNEPTGVQLDASDGRFNSVTYSGQDTLWAFGTQSGCGSSPPLICLYWVILNVDPLSGRPTGIYIWNELYSNIGWNLSYPAVAETMTSPPANAAVIGIFDYTCSYSQCTNGQDPGAEGFQTDTQFNFTVSGRQSGTTIIQPDGCYPTNFNCHRWGDYSGCAYIAGTSPSADVCDSMWADKNSPYPSWAPGENIEVIAHTLT